MRPRGNTQEDYLLRIIRQAAELLRQLRHQLLGTASNPESIRRDAAAAVDLLLGSQAPVLAVLDPASTVHLLGHPALVALWTALLDVVAAAAFASGDATVAARRRARATALRTAARAIWSEDDVSVPAPDEPASEEGRE
jgi:hypothetical protein